MAWLVCAGMFFAYFLETSLVKSLGVLLPVLREQFSTQTWVIGLAISSAPGFGAFACILVAGWKQLISHRVIVVLFGSIASLGMIGGSMTTNVPMFAMAVMVTGCLNAAQAVGFAVLPLYFDKYFDTVNGIVHAGNAFGVIAMPLITQILLSTYGWRGAMLIIGGLTAHVVVCGALLRPVAEQPREEQCHFSGCDQYDTWSINEVDANQDQLHLPGGDIIKDIKKSSMLTDDHRRGKRSSRSLEECPLSADNGRTDSDGSKNEHVPGHTEEEQTPFISNVINTLNLHLFLNIDFVSLVCMYTATGYYYTGWLIYLVPHAEHLGFQPYASAALATYGGFGNLLGSCSFPLLAKVLSTKVIIILANTLAFLSLVVDPILSDFHFYIGMALASFALNIGSALWACSTCKELRNAVDEVDYSSALNLIYIGYALGSLCSGFLSGWLYDRFGNYSALFLFLSIMPLISLTPMVWNMLRNGHLKKERLEGIPLLAEQQS